LTKIAVVKPDHLGDLILSSPAIRAAQHEFGAISLFVSHSTKTLARFLFPDIELRPINFPHLSRSAGVIADLDVAARELNEFDLVLWLRDDPFIGPFAKAIKVPQDFAAGGHLEHETSIQKRMMLRHVKNYSRTALFNAVPIRWPEVVRKVGLCIGSGFPTNRWPNVYWLQLASTLLQSGLTLVLIGGPGEIKDMALLSRCLQGQFARTIIGGADFRTFLDALEDIDLIVATDGGSGHLCSLQKPVLSIFGSSPWRRYAPFGPDNIVLTRDLGCSPCCNFSMEEVNGCVTRECVVGLEPDLVARIVGGSVSLEDSTIVVQRGTSHTFEAG
jgi:ADP-heptose:LPS heptosyltransferase